MKKRILLFIILSVVLLPILFLSFQYFSRATSIKANLSIDTYKTMGNFPDRWRAFAQGGEEKDKRMLENVTPQLSNLYPKYIRIDHVYDFYDVVSKDNNGNLMFDWTKLDATVCDIYHTGAKPFFALGYMPPSISEDGSLISKPKNWDDWSLVVQKTIERYSGKTTRLCGQIMGFWTTDIYYEVWNEPDLESFGKWSLYQGHKDYKTLYFYSTLGAQNARNVNKFNIGGPATTALYKNWITVFLDYVNLNKLRLDFLSWHHYSKNPSDFTDDIIKLNEWLSPGEYRRFQRLPKIVTEWGYDSNPNPIADTNIGAAYTTTAIRNFIGAGYELAFLFEIIDGPTPRWGIFNNDSSPKIRYKALSALNGLSGKRLQVNGEGTFVNALATKSDNDLTIIITNYDPENKNIEMVPLTITNLKNGSYQLTTNYVGEQESTTNIKITNSQFNKEMVIRPNTIVSLRLTKIE